MSIRIIVIAVILILALSSIAIAAPATRPEEDPDRMLPTYTYELNNSVEVNGRQGVCSEGDYYWVSGSATLAKYDKDWNLIELNEDPFVGYEIEVNHIGDIDVYNNELYIGAECFMDGVGTNIQIAVYDGDTLELKRTFPFNPESGQLECSGIAVDPDTKTVWMCSWVGEESGRYLYKYDLTDGTYLGKVHMQMPPQWIQGIAYYEGCIFLTADDGTADDDESDHLYRTRIEEGATSCTVTLERTFDDVIRQGEIEGLTFDKKNGHLLVLYNRGTRIVLGMPKGFYEGYDKEISEVFIYDIEKREASLSDEKFLLTGVTQAAEKDSIPYWNEDSPAMHSIMQFIETVTDDTSLDYVPEEERIAVFDLDGTLTGERYPEASMRIMVMERLLEIGEEADPDSLALAKSMEEAIKKNEKLPKFDLSATKEVANLFSGLTLDEYKAYLQDFMNHPVAGFEGMTYGTRFFKPMVSLVQYLAENGFQVYIISGSERMFVREQISGTLDKWIPASHVIGSTLSLTATGEGDTPGSDYTYAADDQVLLGDSVVTKGVKMNKVSFIVNEIGAPPVLVFGNSSGDYAMGQYCVQNGGKAYMLLCDDTVRDYGDEISAAECSEACASLGFEAVSMRDEFETIYGEEIDLSMELDLAA